MSRVRAPFPALSLECTAIRDTLDETRSFRFLTAFERRPEKSYLRIYPAATYPTGQRGFCSGEI